MSLEDAATRSSLRACLQAWAAILQDMLRGALLALALTVVGVAQDVGRMNEVAESHVSTNRFMGAALVARGDEVIFERSYGWANIEWNVASTPTTKFRIGSVTKQFTAAAILRWKSVGSFAATRSKTCPGCAAAWTRNGFSLCDTSGFRASPIPDYKTLSFRRHGEQPWRESGSSA